MSKYPWQTEATRNCARWPGAKTVKRDSQSITDNLNEHPENKANDMQYSNICIYTYIQNQFIPWQNFHLGRWREIFFVYLSIYLSIYLSVYGNLYLRIYIYMHMFSIHMYTYRTSGRMMFERFWPGFCTRVESGPFTGQMCCFICCPVCILDAG